MAQKPFLPEFPELPDRLIQIIGQSEYRDWKRRMEEWLQENQVGVDQYTNQTINNFFQDIVQKTNFFPPKYCSVGLFDPSDGYNSSVNGTDTIIKQFGQLLAIERSYDSVGTTQTGNTVFVERGAAITGKAYLFTPPDDFWLPVVVKGVFPVTYPHFGFLPPPFNRGCIRTSFNGRMLRRGDFAGLGDLTQGIQQIWYPGYGEFGGNRIWIYSKDENDWEREPLGSIDIGVNHFDVFGGNWFDLNVTGSSWRNVMDLRGYEFNAFPVNNFDPVPTGNFNNVPNWQDV